MYISYICAESSVVALVATIIAYSNQLDLFSLSLFVFVCVCGGGGVSRSPEEKGAGDYGPFSWLC